MRSAIGFAVNAVNCCFEQQARDVTNMIRDQNERLLNLLDSAIETAQAFKDENVQLKLELGDVKAQMKMLEKRDKWDMEGMVSSSRQT